MIFEKTVGTDERSELVADVNYFSFGATVPQWARVS
jgi:hypothetical protein